MRKNAVHMLVLSLTLSVLIFLTACNNHVNANTDSSEPNTDFNSKYDPPITLTAMGFIGSQVQFAAGENIENNIWTRAYLDKLGIKIKYIFTTPDYQTYDTKVNMAIATNSLPDIMPLYTTLFFKAADTGRCADLTDVFSKYALKEIKDLMNLNDGIPYKSATVGGKLYALANPPGIADSVEMLWIRTDWLKNLNLQPPATMEEVSNIAKAFVNSDPDRDGKNDTYGLSIDKDLGGIDGFLNGYHAYRSIWIEKDGKLARGEVQPEMKLGLSKLAELYKAGAIDQEFILKTWQDTKSDIADESIGLLYCPSWAPDGIVNQAILTNPQAEWGTFALPSCDDKPALTQVESRISNFIAVKAGSKHPEALIKIANLEYTLSRDTSPEARDYHDKDGINTFWYPVVRLGDPGYNQTCHNLVVEAFNTGNTQKLNGEQLGYYNRAKAWVDKKDPEGWGMWRIFGPGGSAGTANEISTQNLYYSNKGWGPETPAWKQYGTNLHYKQLEFFTNFIIGVTPMADFDKWVSYFMTNGGAKATEEVNNWYELQLNKK